MVADDLAVAVYSLRAGATLVVCCSMVMVSLPSGQEQRAARCVVAHTHPMKLSFHSWGVERVESLPFVAHSGNCFYIPQILPGYVRAPSVSVTRPGLVPVKPCFVV